jgi:hypothetical protein
MIVNLVLDTGVAARIRALLSFQDNRATVRHDQPRPNQQQSRLAERNLAIINSYQSRSLRNQTDTAGGRIVHCLCHLRRDLSREVRSNARDEGGRNLRIYIDPRLVIHRPHYSPQQMQGVLANSSLSDEAKAKALSEFREQDQPIQMPFGNGYVLIDPLNPCIQQFVPLR